ncbi:MAG TPA: DUF3450 domain-containing protein [Desulfobacteraceae bacterium]|nr:DUF3450 domain-containing protein [Deltaproteobacteria bacterium]MBW2355611.1 DUF3450 domain-containing protein [Deltaproteobacteria bacterium]HDI60674.1 DUF3450 domain-containing protein [Desulfobacteraceae bacterium]
MKHPWKVFAGLTLAALMLPAAALAEKDDVQRQVEQPVQQAIQIRRDTQQAEAAWRADRERMTAAYEQLQQEQARLEAQEKALAESVAAARDRVAAKQAQLDAIAQITDRVTPFLHLLRARLAQRIEQDLPFLTAERQQRLARLDALLDDPAVAVSEKLRKVFEALLVEAEYGNTIEVYQETVTVDGQPLLADIFRLGRLGLYYQRLDRQAGGFYNVARDTWEPLDKAANRALTTAIAIGTKRQPVEILDMPLGRLAQP